VVLKSTVAFLVGALFAFGLALSGMTLPSKVIGFLDVFGHWDPSLAFVMAGAVVSYFVFFRALRGTAPVLGDTFYIPAAREIDRPLVVGSALFGMGWGVAGYCPGPALTSLGTLSTDVLVFVAAMIAGMVLHRGWQWHRTERSTT